MKSFNSAFPLLIVHLLIIIIIIAAVSCSGRADAVIPEEIALLENLTIISQDEEPQDFPDLSVAAVYGDTDKVLIGQMGAFAVDNSNRVYLADRNQQVIHVYSPEGQHISKIGREGDGPGEFRRINAIHTDDQHLHVMDTSTMRITRFSLHNQEWINDYNIPFEFEISGGYVSFPNTFYIIDDDYYLVNFGVGFTSGQDDESLEPKVTGKLYHRPEELFLEGNVYEFSRSDAIVHREGNTMSVMSPPYKRRSNIMYNNGTIAFGWSEDLLFKFYDHSGRYEEAVYHPVIKPVLDRDEVLKEYSDRDEPWRSMIRNDRMPETWPAFYTSVLDDTGRVWAAVYADNQEIYNWRVLGRSGKLYASFDLPREKEISLVKNDAVYARETDEDTGLQQIVKYHAGFFTE